jgi:ribosomal-protein-alanine N-acetyltransferase
VRVERRCQSHPWTADHFRADLEDAGRSWVLLLRSPRAAEAPERGIRAYVVLRLAADELQVTNLGVVPELRRRGLARWLLRFGLEMGARRGARHAVLEVRRSNDAALALYTSLGFRPLGVRSLYYDGPKEDAIVLERSELDATSLGHRAAEGREGREWTRT